MKIKKKFICKNKYLSKIKFIKYDNKMPKNNNNNIEEINIHSTKNINFVDIFYGILAFSSACFIYYIL
jgi:hypothetical protein